MSDFLTDFVNSLYFTDENDPESNVSVSTTDSKSTYLLTFEELITFLERHPNKTIIVTRLETQNEI